jgi:hypothetical protein
VAQVAPPLDRLLWGSLTLLGRGPACQLSADAPSNITQLLQRPDSFNLSQRLSAEEAGSVWG